MPKFTRSDNPYENSQRLKLLLWLAFFVILGLFALVCYMASRSDVQRVDMLIPARMRFVTDYQRSALA